MSYCKELGKDKLIFLTRKDYDKSPPKIKLPEYEGEPGGLILPNGDINWGCPCLGPMATGPCGFAFRDAFTCVRMSKEEPKGTECYEKFKVMQDCFDKYPTLFGSIDDDNMKDLEKNDSSKGVNAESKT